MNLVWIRFLVYATVPALAATLPGVTYDGVAQTMTIDLETAAIGFAGGLTAAAGVLQIWGKK
jgi:hypothetical protein